MPVCPSPGEQYYGQDANYYSKPMSYTKLGFDGEPLPDTAKEWAMVKDNVAGLVWEVKTSENMSDRFDWDEAKAYAFNLDLGGFSDWRLPNIKELRSLVDYNNFNPTIDPLLQAWTVPLNYWSSTTKEGDSVKAKAIFFHSGVGFARDKNEVSHVRCVRNASNDLQKANIIFDWLESLFPEILYPASQQTQEVEGIYYRHYQGSNVFIATYQGDLWFIDHLGELHNLGKVVYWLPYAQ